MARVFLSLIFGSRILECAAQLLLKTTGSFCYEGGLLFGCDRYRLVCPTRCAVDVGRLWNGLFVRLPYNLAVNVEFSGNLGCVNIPELQPGPFIRSTDRKGRLEDLGHCGLELFGNPIVEAQLVDLFRCKGSSLVLSCCEDPAVRLSCCSNRRILGRTGRQWCVIAPQSRRVYALAVVICAYVRRATWRNAPM